MYDATSKELLRLRAHEIRGDKGPYLSKLLLQFHQSIHLVLRVWHYSPQLVAKTEGRC